MSGLARVEVERHRSTRKGCKVNRRCVAGHQVGKCDGSARGELQPGTKMARGHPRIGEASTGPIKGKPSHDAGRRPAPNSVNCMAVAVAAPPPRKRFELGHRLPNSVCRNRRRRPSSRQSLARRDAARGICRRNEHCRSMATRGGVNSIHIRRESGRELTARRRQVRRAHRPGAARTTRPAEMVPGCSAAPRRPAVHRGSSERHPAG